MEWTGLKETIAFKLKDEFDRYGQGMTHQSLLTRLCVYDARARVWHRNVRPRAVSYVVGTTGYNTGTAHAFPSTCFSNLVNRAIMATDGCVLTRGGRMCLGRGIQRAPPLPSVRGPGLVVMSTKDDDMELAVFRFTLGIPGFDDALIPRVAGIVVASLLLINHIASEQPVSLSQSITEVLGMLLTGIGVAAPTVQRRLEDVTPGRGRRAPQELVEGGRNVFAIADTLPDSLKEEIAWASFTILKNSNVCGICLFLERRMILCRGILGTEIAAGEATDVLKNASKDFEDTFGFDEKDKTLAYAETVAQMRTMKMFDSRIIPRGACGVAIIPISPLPGHAKTDASSIGSMLLVCDRERSMSQKELQWCKATASKVYHTYAHS